MAHSTALPEAGARLAPIPSPAMGLYIRDADIRLCARFWLGVTLFEDVSPCHTCEASDARTSWSRTPTVIDQYGDHQVGCVSDGDRNTACLGSNS